jgi:biopolymer transport protein ExbD
MRVGSSILDHVGFKRHLVARAHQKRSKKRLIIAGLMLTSMVDMFSLLVIFLLQTFSATPELLLVSQGVTLPIASTGHEVKDAPVIALGQDGVFLDQKFIGKLDAVLKNPEALMKGLERLRENWQKVHPNQKFPGEINFQAHKDVPSTTVSTVMGMLPSQAFGSIQLAVVSSGGGS